MSATSRNRIINILVHIVRLIVLSIGLTLSFIALILFNIANTITKVILFINKKFRSFARNPMKTYGKVDYLDFQKDRIKRLENQLEGKDIIESAEISSEIAEIERRIKKHESVAY